MKNYFMIRVKNSDKNEWKYLYFDEYSGGYPGWISSTMGHHYQSLSTACESVKRINE